jgi:glycerophosphoryl diester phosphodiesterase
VGVNIVPNCPSTSEQQWLCRARSLLMMIGIGSACVTARATETIAHRGESADAPENTLAAFRLAWERKVPAIELDVHLTRDDRLIVIHDADTKRTTGESLTIKDSTLAELRKLDAGRWKDECWAGEKLPTLEEALATIPDRGRCFIELKVGPEAVPALVKCVRDSGKRPEQLAVIAFNAKTIAEAKRRLPEIDAFGLSKFKQDKATGAWSPTVEELIAQAKSINADGLNLLHQGPLDRESVRRIHSAGLKLFVWTIDDLEIARRFADMGVDGITTNRGQFLNQRLARHDSVTSAPAASKTAADDSLRCWSAGVRVQRVSTTPGRHTIHSYYVCNPESPDGRRVLYYASMQANGHIGEICVLDRETGRETVLARNVHVEDAHRAACQQWVSGGRRVAYHEVRSNRWRVVVADAETGKPLVTIDDRQLGFGQPDGDMLPIYGCH